MVAYRRPMEILTFDALENANGNVEFEGADHGDVEVGPGHVTVVPPGEPHGFTSSGDVPLRQVNIHVSPRMISQWLD